MAITTTDLGHNSVAFGASVSITTGVAVPAGSLIAVAVWENASDIGQTTTNSVTDNGGNTYTKIVDKVAGGVGGVLGIWYCKNASLASGKVITYTPHDTNNGFAISAFYATGIDTTAPLDTAVTASANAGSGASPSVISGAPAASGELFVAAVGWANSSAPSFTQDTGNGWASPFSADTAHSNSSVAGGNQVNAGTGTKTFSPTVGGAGSTQGSAAIVVGFKAAAGTIVSGTGSSAGAGVALGIGLSLAIGAASSIGVATVAGIGIGAIVGTGNSAGHAIAQATSSANKNSSARSSGTTTVSGIGNELKASNAFASGISIVASLSAALKSSTILANGISSAAAFSINLATGTGHAAGSSTVIGLSSSLAQSVALANGSSTADATGIGFINPLETVLMPSKASGPYFTRKRFEKLLEEEEQKRLAELKRLEAEKQKQLDDAIAQRKELIAKRVAELLRNSGATPPELTGPPAISFGPDYTAHARHAQDNDEDEAIALLLLS